MAATLISLVRHGEVHNPQRILYGRLPRFGLSATGIAQAKAAGQFLRQRPFAAVFSSPLLRARQTARLLLAGSAEQKLHISRYIHEVHNPNEGRLIAELIGRAWNRYDHLPPGYETPADVLRRMQKFLRRVRRRYPGQHVVAVTHGDPILLVVLWRLGLSFAPQCQEALRGLGMSAGYPAHASITTLIYPDTGQDLPDLSYVEPWSAAGT